MHYSIRVLLADDHPFVRAGIKATLAAEPGILVVGEASDGHQALYMCQELQPDILLLDLGMPGPSPFDTVAALHSSCPALRIVVLTAYDDDAYIRSFKNTGVAGYLIKDEMPQTIVRALHGVMRGERWFIQTINAQLTRVSNNRLDVALPNPLTTREVGVLRLVVGGNTNHEIGTALGISEKTVEKYLGEIFTKLDVATRVEAAVWAVRTGLA